ncbi:MAG TPA: hypothetical protein VF826_12835 [Chloroflexia bacterium]
MESTSPGVVPDAARSKARRIYVVAGLLALLLVVVLVFIVPALRGPISIEPQPSQGIVELAASYRPLQTLGQQGVPPAWGRDGRGMATYSDNKVQLWEFDGDRLWERGSLSIDGVQGMLWSPDGGTLAGHSVGASNMPPAPGSYAIPETPWLPGYGFVTPTLTLIDPETASVRHSTDFTPPTDLPPPFEGSPGWRWVASDFRLLGWTDSGRNLVFLYNLSATDDWGAEGRIQIATIVGYQVWDVQTGKLARNQVMSGSTYPATYRTTLYDAALSPDGRTIAFALRDENPRPGMPFDPDLSLELWDVAAGQRKHSVPGLKAEYGLDPQKPWRKMDWSPDSATLYVATKASVQVVNASRGDVERQLPDVIPPTSTPTIIPTWIPTSLPQAPPRPMPIQTGGPIVATPTSIVSIPPAVSDFFRSLLPKPRPAPAPTVALDPNYYAPVIGMALSPAGDVLAVHDLRVIRLWDTATGELKLFAEVPEQIPVYTWSPANSPAPPPVVAWSADGRLLSSLLMMGGSRVWLIDPGTGKPLKPLGKPASALNWSPYANLLAISSGSGSARGVLELWHAKDAATMQVTPGSSGVP